MRSARRRSQCCDATHRSLPSRCSSAVSLASVTSGAPRPRRRRRWRLRPRACAPAGTGGRRQFRVLCAAPSGHLELPVLLLAHPLGQHAQSEVTRRRHPDLRRERRQVVAQRHQVRLPARTAPTRQHPKGVNRLTDDDRALLEVVWLRTEELASLLGVDTSKLRRWRTARPPQGPPFICMPGGITRYRERDVQSWLARRRSEPGRVA